MLFILHTVPVAFSADSKLIRYSVLLLPETLDAAKSKRHWPAVFNLVC